MEKFNPTYSLEEFKNSDFKITITARNTAYDLGFTTDDIHDVVSTMICNIFTSR